MKNLVALFFLLYSVGLVAQSPLTISGTVRSGTGEALSNANIILKKLSGDSSIIAFALSDSKGSFSIEVPANTTGSLSLEVSIIGYAAQEKILESGRSYNLDFTMQTKSLVLKEVVVKDKPAPFRAKNDTTTYNLSQYSDGTERKVEDLLRKLPGIKVDENGTITFKGKAIDKIMLEGDDFFEKNYKLLSKNVSAALIDKIQAIENYNENNLLKGIQRSDKVVLNLKLKKKFVSSLFGNGEMAAGLPRQYNLNSTLFSFINTFKAGFLGNINNTGFDALDDAKYNLSSGDGETGHLNTEANPGQLPIVNELLSNLSISKTRYITNQARLGALQVSVPLSKKIKMNVYGYWQKDSRLMVNNNFTSYLLRDSVFTVREDGANTHSPLSAYLRMKLQYSIDSVSSMTYTGSLLSARPEYQYQYHVVQDPGTAEQTIADVQASTRNNFHRLTYIRRFSASGALVTEVEYRDARQQLKNHVSPNRYERIIDKGDSSFSALQSFLLDEKRLNVNTRWLGVKGNHNYELSIGYSRYNGQLHSDLHVENGALKLPANDSVFSNQLDYRKHTWVAEVKDELTWGRFKYS
ncbi:MAG TPA: carboxypeptidase-like regulatory domain-containing protein, partial [Chitinophagaceae bacterium]|nr:carboxypeptidase-like regulatory domain-containing protein [Chitinophagaceae bacterium]